MANMTSDCVDITESTRKVTYSVTPDSIGMSAARKVPLMQGVVAKIIMQIFQEGPYFALPNKNRFADIKAVCNYFQGQSDVCGSCVRVFGRNSAKDLEKHRPRYYNEAVDLGIPNSLSVSSEARRLGKIPRCFAFRYLSINLHIIK